MTQVAGLKAFKDLNIEPVETPGSGFVGDKISIPKIIGKQITVFWPYKIAPSKWPESGNGKCLTVQIELNGNKRILFTSSIALQEVMKKIPEESFPFVATITMQENDSYQFT